jgi:hypothetical protein
MGELPGTGGSIRQIVCPGTFESADSTDALYEAAVGPDGRVLYLREASPIDAVTASTAALVLGQADDPLNHATVVRPYPYTAGNGTIHQGISNIRWLSGTRAVYLAEKVQYLSTCGGCPLDTVRTGIEMVQVDLSGSSPALSIIPNTLETSSISSGPDSDLVYFTKNGDSRVYQLTLSTGDQSIVHDFGFPLIARDVQVRGTDLFAIVGGRVSHVQDPVLGSVQRDEGGQLREVNLTNGTSVPRIVNGRFFRRPALSPSGNHLAAEAFAATITQCGAFCADTTISKTSDLWLFDLP